MRSTRDVLEDHLRRRLDGDLEADIARNYADDVVALSLLGGGTGHDAVRGMADDLDRAMPNARFEIEELLVEGPAGLLVWSGRSDTGVVCEGTDSFLVDDGRITLHTVHYHVRHRDRSEPCS